MKLAAASLSAMTATSYASAAYLIDTGPGTPNVGGLALGPSQRIASYFSLAQDSTLSSIEGYIGGFGGAASVAIYSDGEVPVYQLFSSSFHTVTTYPNPGDQWQGVYNLNWNLAAGSYWVAFTSNGNNWMSGIGLNSQTPKRALSISFPPFWVTNAAAVGVRIAGMSSAAPGVPSTVPEPASWAMMIAGFGLVGASMRRRKGIRLSFA